MSEALHKLKILVVDDDPDIASAFSHLLQLADYEVLIAGTGEDLDAWISMPN